MSCHPQYSPEQLSAYLNRIHFTGADHTSKGNQLEFLTLLVRKQLEHVPFETLALHYSVGRRVSLEPYDLFEKIVQSRRGGYCLENNTFFGTVLRSFGFQVIGVICRITMATRAVYDGSWRAMSHMANIVTIDQKKYLVDVGYGADGPPIPLLLASNEIQPGTADQRLKLEYRSLPQHEDPSQKVWVYSQSRDQGEWADVYHFPEIEFFPPDFEVLNYHATTQSLWSRTVVVQRFIFDKSNPMSPGSLLLVSDELKSGNCKAQNMKLLQKLESENQRLEVLERFFGIQLTDEQKNAIKGRPTELPYIYNAI